MKRETAGIDEGAHHASYCCLHLTAACVFAQGEGADATQVPSPPVQAEEEAAEASEIDDGKPVPTTVLSAADAIRLRQNSGITLQWIGWDERGDATVGVDAFGTYRLYGRQEGPKGELLIVLGRITEIGPDYFLFDGLIQIAYAPDPDRECYDNRTWRFEATQGHKYYRLREFEWCDGLTDYIDIYF
ncbi:hypothetical protein [Altererythrobacter sp. MTPC7]|uniref:hypothetical protein n=1 Tax=Altererythrobacter sp. MTPC7 TaxID=3056567 RepID=UPI0036F2A054